LRSETPAVAAAAPPLVVRRPAILSREPIDPATALGRLFAIRPVLSAGERDGAAAQQLGPLSPALSLLPSRERGRAELLAIWGSALFLTAEETGPASARIERLNRSAYLLARALARQRVPSPFAVALAGESERRTMPRRALDALLAEARKSAVQPDPSTPADWEVRTREIAGAVAESLLGATPTPATVDAASGILRLVRLLRVTDERRAGRFHLPIEAPPTLAGHPAEDDLAGAIAEECEAIHQLLLRGARGVGEVPLTFRAALAGALALGLRLLGKVEEQPRSLLVRPLRLGRLETAWTLHRIRREKLG